MTDTELNGLMLMVGYLATFLLTGWLSLRFLDFLSLLFFGGRFFQVLVKDEDGWIKRRVRVWAKTPSDAALKAIMKLQKEADNASKKD